MHLKKLILFVFFLLIYKSSFSQLNNIECLIGKDKQYVISYFEKLNNAKPNPYSKIEKDISEKGDLVLINEFALKDQSYYKCFSISVKFQRFTSGEEMCILQNILGSVEFATDNLNFIKDNFKYVESNLWEKAFFGEYKIKASFKRNDSDYPTYLIQYYIGD
jgi:hypothetical protein